MHIPVFLKRHWLASLITIIVVVPSLGFTLYAGSALHVTYSTGTRAGYLQKVSRRGWVCKTWEGELQLTPVPGTAPEKFIFSVRSDSIANALNQVNGQAVVLTYAQHKGLPSCFGDTEYFITGVRLEGR